MKINLLCFLVLLSLTGNSQNVYIPDINFKALLIADTTINTNKDNEIQISEATALTADNIYGSSRNISDLTGVEEFKHLKSLIVSDNNIQSINLKQNSQLETLNLNRNNLTSLDLSNNSQIKSLSCEYNKLTNLNLGRNTALEFLLASNNELTALDLSLNVGIVRAECSNNKLNSLLIGQNITLVQLFAANNKLTKIDLSNCFNLGTLYLDNNYLKKLYLSKNTDLTSLDCSNNLIDSLDLRYNSDLLRSFCDGNSLSYLNIANGNNTSIKAGEFNSTKNPNLSCIQVDSEQYSNIYWINGKDSLASFSELCKSNNGGNSNSISQLEESNGITIYPNPANSYLHINSNYGIRNVEIYSITGEQTLMQKFSSSPTIDISEIPNGMYIIRLDTIKGIVLRKLVIY